jgi:hypothetical protein
MKVVLFTSPPMPKLGGHRSRSPVEALGLPGEA